MLTRWGVAGKYGYQGGVGCGRVDWGGKSSVGGADGKGRGTAGRGGQERRGWCRMERNGAKRNEAGQDGA